MLNAEHELQAALGESSDPKELAQIDAYDAVAECLADETAEAETSTIAPASLHVIAAPAATLFSVGIAA